MAYTPKPRQDYTITEIILTTATQILCRGIGNRDGRSVLIRRTRFEGRSGREIERLHQDYEITHRLDSPFVVRPIALLTTDRRTTVVAEDRGDEPLVNRLGAPMPPGAFLGPAIAIATAIADVHRLGFIHRDLNPTNILMHPATGAARLTGFDLATELPRVAVDSGDTDESHSMIEGTLSSMAPEQTGRMNRSIDHRADLYALGVIYYEMVTATLPFHADDPLEWIHCHIAREPPPPTDLVPTVPVTISRIILKLLAKQPEDRYQSGHGLIADLEICREHWRRNREIAEFALGAHDTAERLTIPPTLYGRDREIAALHATFARCAASGRPELMLVSGYSGIGKSALIGTLRQPTVDFHGTFLAGKFDAGKQSVPYATITEAFQTLLTEKLAESEAHLTRWRTRLQDTLGVNGRIIADVVPQLDYLMSRQPPVAELPLGEAHSRFIAVFRHFVDVFATADHPLVLFLDDLQWADAASLRLLQDLVSQPGPRHLLVVGACRENEIGPSHPLRQMIAAARRSEASIGEIILGTLDPASIEAFIGAILHCDKPETASLANLVHAKTGGNPFFMIQFLTELDESRLIAFDAQTRAWRWNLRGIEAKSLTDNVANLMAAKLRRLMPETRAVLEGAACVGHTCDLLTLSTILEQPEAEIRPHLTLAVTEGLLTRSGKTYRFVHDRIQEAALALMPADERATMHLRIGRRLLTHTPSHEINRKIFDVVNHLNRGYLGLERPTLARSSACNSNERAQLAELNLVAGRKAKAQAAYDAAAAFLAAGAELLSPAVNPDDDTQPTNTWSRRYRLTFDLHLERAQCEYLRGALDSAEALLETLSVKAQTPVDHAAVCRMRVALHTTRGEMDRAIICGIESLRQFNVRLPAFPTRAQVDAAFAEVWHALGERTIESLIDLPPMTDPEMRMVIDLLSDLNTPAIFGRRNLLNLTLARMVTLSISHGLTDASVWAFTWFGAILVQRDFGRYQDGYRFGKLGYDLMLRNTSNGFRAKVSLTFGDLINFYVHHVAEGRPYIEAAFHAATEVGDLPWACYSCNHIITNMLSTGDPLDAVWAESVRRLDFVRKAGDRNIEDIITSQQRFIQAMRGLTAESGRFEGPDFDQGAFEAHIETSEMPLMVCWYYILKLETQVIFGDGAGALASAQRAGALIEASGPDIQGTDYDFFAALALAANIPQAAPERHPELRAALDRHLERLREWADSCPANFLNRVQLVEAETARLIGRDLEAQSLYEQAIRTAHVNGFTHHEALAYELAGRHYRDRGFELIADTYLERAIRRYGEWGARGKVAQLESRSPHIRRPATETTAGTGFAAAAGHLDLLSVVKAAQSISGELEPSRLQEALLRIALQQAGAHTGLLMLAEKDELYIRARAETEGGMGSIRVTVGGAESVTDDLVPPTLLTYVRRTRLPVVLANATTDSPLGVDPYLLSRRPRSVLCLPIVREGKLMGVLYLENNLLTGAFTTSKLAALELLASQAAITLETATASAERRRAEVALRDQLHFTERLIETMPAPMFYKDEAGIYAGCNAAFERIVNLPRREVVGKTVYQVWPKDIADTAAASDTFLFTTPGTQVYETQIGFADGSMHSVVFHKATLSRADGSVSGLVGVIWDVTERKQAVIAMARAKETAEAASLAKSRFLAAASHDMRQPFQAIHLYHNLLTRHLTNSHQQELGERLGEAIAAGNDLLNALFEASVLDSGTIRATPSDIALEPLLTRLAGEMVEQAADKGLSLRLVPCRATTTSDPVLLLQILRNLLTNAIRYTNRGGIVFGCRRHGAEINIEVWDTGIGIPEEKLDLIFEDFFQIGNPERQRAKGFGLGLAIARRTAKLLGHTLTVRSRLDHGSSFALRVPRGHAALSATPSEDTMPHAPHAPTILVIEDEPLLLNALRLMLEYRDYRVLAADGAASALKLIASDTQCPDLILSDYRLPGPLNGAETIARLRATLKRTVPAVLITGDTDLPAGHDPTTEALRILHKPVSTDNLYRTIDAMIGT